MNGVVALLVRREVIVQADVAESSAHHHFVIATSRAIGVEIALIYPMLDQVLARRATGREATCRRDMVRRDGVIKHCQYTCLMDVLYRLRLDGHVLEKWRLLYVG